MIFSYRIPPEPIPRTAVIGLKVPQLAFKLLDELKRIEDRNLGFNLMLLVAGKMLLQALKRGRWLVEFAFDFGPYSLFGF